MNLKFDLVKKIDIGEYGTIYLFHWNNFSDDKNLSNWSNLYPYFPIYFNPNYNLSDFDFQTFESGIVDNSVKNPSITYTILEGQFDMFFNNPKAVNSNNKITLFSTPEEAVFYVFVKLQELEKLVAKEGDL